MGDTRNAADNGDAAPAEGFFLVGPTASGKTEVAQWIAEREGGEILSADSMLVYSGMDIGTAKPEPQARQRVRYHGIDLVTPDCSFSLGSYLAAVRLSLAGSTSRLIVTGGTGLYVKGLTQGLDTAPPANPGVRAYWTDVLEEDGIIALQEALRRRSPGLYEALRDKENVRRLIRALELSEAGVTERPRQWASTPAGAPLAGLRPSAELLKRRIEARVRRMFDGGLLEEVRALSERRPPWSETARQAIGYAEAAEYLAGRCSLEAAVERATIRTRQLAKRQRTWFAHQADVRWIDIKDGMPVEEIAGRVSALWREHGPTRIRL